ncbi:hypothetical protein NSQ54_09705 [Alkalihalobacillus sp. FSL W8-0930]
MITTFVQTAVIDIEFFAPLLCLLGQLLNRISYVKLPFLPSWWLAAGLYLSKCMTYRQSSVLGILMGVCYGLAAIGTVSSLKQSCLSFRLFL